MDVLQKLLKPSTEAVEAEYGRGVYNARAMSSFVTCLRIGPVSFAMSTIVVGDNGDYVPVRSMRGMWASMLVMRI